MDVTKQFRASQAVAINNDKLEHHGKAGHVTGFGTGETDGMVEVLIDGESEPMAFAPADLQYLGH